MQYDTVYYWVGGREGGYWARISVLPRDIEKHIKGLEKLGYIAVRGCTFIGPPYEAPGDDRFKGV